MHGTIPATENGTVVPFPHEQGRTRSYLLEAEVERLTWAERKHGRYGHRDATMILVSFRHGLRVGELVTLQWSHVHFESATLGVHRLKYGKPASHPLTGSELRALRKLRREQPAGLHFVFIGERNGAAMTTRDFAQNTQPSGEAHRVSDCNALTYAPDTLAAISSRMIARTHARSRSRASRLGASSASGAPGCGGLLGDQDSLADLEGRGARSCRCSL